MVRLAGVLALLCVAGVLLPEPWVTALTLTPNAKLWTLWSSHLVHYGPGHAWANGMAIFVLGWMLAKERLSLVALALSLWFPIISLVVVAWDTELTQYRGASGIASFLLVMFCLDGARSERAGTRRIAGLAFMVWVGQTAMGAMGSSLIPTTLPLGVSPSWQVHLLAGLGGLAVKSLTQSLKSIPRQS